MEKAFTTPEQYPLTLKATTSGCNQKSNRDPTVAYTEDMVMDGLDQLREAELVAEVFPGGGRTARYRHYMRHCFDFSEGQFAIVAELMLRGRQQLGELRTRASRMVRIESSEQLREELTGLKEMGYLQTNGPLDRRGIEVDHTFYLDKERMTISDGESADQPSAPTSPVRSEDAAATAGPAAAPAVSGEIGSALSVHVESLERLLQQLQASVQKQAGIIHDLEQSQADLQERLDKLEQDLGG
ncbi:UNVERIFIED_CONTAM: hypothetical protein GTU68_044964 [Idotea baltica]|nr:hypothetical protein [Idotea baltica]